MKLGELDVYRLSREIGKSCWNIYSNFDWETRKIIGHQWIRSTDSISANIAEGFGRFHYLDKNKFNYNARGSLYESLDWTQKLLERNIVSESECQTIISKLQDCLRKLNGYIKSTKKQAKAK